MSELVHVIHPGLPGAPASVQARAAFDRSLKGKGWIEVSPEDAIKHDTAIEAGEPSPIAKTPKAARSGGDV